MLSSKDEKILALYLFKLDFFCVMHFDFYFQFFIHYSGNVNDSITSLNAQEKPQCLI